MPERWAMLGMVLMGLGGVVAGLVGVGLPEGRRLGALFALIAGAGVGVAVLGVGALFDETGAPTEFTFFLASLLGFFAVCVSSWGVWRRAGDRSTHPEDLAAPR
jgi:drug/metabolite transporter (DMT)-like permease